MSPILHSKPWLTEADQRAVAEVLRSGMLAQGEKTREFERALGAWVGGHGVAVSSGTAALELALNGLGVGPGDEVIVPSYTCHCVGEAVASVGALPVPCDCGPDWLPTAETIAPRISGKTRAIIVAHLYGTLAEIEPLRRFGIPIIEDCAQALGAAGHCPIRGDVAVYSFHPTKCLTTGEGGMVVSPSSEKAAALRKLRDGGTTEISARLCAPLSDLGAALGLSQLARYQEGLDRRAQLAARYRAELEPVIPTAFSREESKRANHFRFLLRIEGGLEAVQDRFMERGIHVRRGVDHLIHRIMKLGDTDFPNAVASYNCTVSLPLYPALTDAEFSRCLDAAKSIFATCRGARA